MLRGRVDSWLGGLLVCSLAGGCDFIFRIDHIDDRTDDSGVHPDSLLPDGPPVAMCATPILIDNFTLAVQGQEVCAPWGSGYADQGASAIEGNGLVLTPATDKTTVAGCTSNAEHAFGSGLTALVDDVIFGADVYTVLQIHGVLEYQLKVGGDGKLHFQTSSSNDVAPAILYNRAEMRWWRIRPAPPSTLVGEYSGDGQTWTTLGTVPVQTLPATVGIELTGGTNTAGAMGHAVFSQLVICPSTN